MRGHGKTAVAEPERSVRQSSVYIGEEEQRILDRYPVVSKSKLVRLALQYYDQQVDKHGLDLNTFMPKDHPTEPSRKRP